MHILIHDFIRMQFDENDDLGKLFQTGSNLFKLVQ